MFFGAPEVPLRRLLLRLLSASKLASSTARSSRDRRFLTTADTGEGGPLLQVPRVSMGDEGPAAAAEAKTASEAEAEVPACSPFSIADPFCTSTSSVRSSVKKIPWLAKAFNSASASSADCEGSKGAEHEAQVDGKANKVVDFDLQYCSSVLHLFNSY